jgi:glycosyltransferase involved in cell wall biosynthesis
MAGLTAAGFRCHLLCLDGNAAGSPPPAYVKSAIAPRIERQRRPGRLRSTAALFSVTPRHFELTFQPSVVAQLEELVRTLAIDVVIAYELGAGDHVARMRVPAGVVKILDGCEPFMFRTARSNVRSAARLWKFKHFLKQMLEGFDAYITVSDAELAWIREEIAPGRGWGLVIPNGTDLPEPYPGPVDLDRIIYTGSLTYRANLEAVEYFIQQVWPRVRERRPSARFIVTGQLPHPTTVRRLQAVPGVTIAGLRADYQHFVASSGVLAVTLLEGGGTRIKILEALAFGCPVVASSKAIEGLTLKAGDEVLVADGPQALADAVLSVITDGALRRRLVENGRRAAARYSWETSQRLLVEAVEASRKQRAFLQPA